MAAAGRKIQDLPTVQTVVQVVVRAWEQVRLLVQERSDKEMMEGHSQAVVAAVVVRARLEEQMGCDRVAMGQHQAFQVALLREQEAAVEDTKTTQVTLEVLEGTEGADRAREITAVLQRELQTQAVEAAVEQEQETPRFVMVRLVVLVSLFSDT